MYRIYYILYILYIMLDKISNLYIHVYVYEFICISESLTSNIIDVDIKKIIHFNQLTSQISIRNMIFEICPIF